MSGHHKRVFDKLAKETGTGFVYGVQTERFKRECRRLEAALDPAVGETLRFSGIDTSEIQARLVRLRQRIEDFEDAMASNQDAEPPAEQAGVEAKDASE